MMSGSLWEKKTDLTGILVLVCLGFSLHGYAFDPLVKSDFNEDVFEKSGWSFFEPGADFDKASVVIGLIPMSPTSADFSDGRGVIITALPGQGAFVFGPAIATGGKLALMRIAVHSLSQGGTIAFGGLNVSPGGTIANVDGSVAYAFETDSGRFMNDFEWIHVVYHPKNGAFIPIFQLAVTDSVENTAVTAMFDRFEVYLLDDKSVTDPALQRILGFNTEIIEPTPTSPPTSIPTPIPTSTPTVTPTPETGSSLGFTVDSVIEITSTNDDKDAFEPVAAFDRNQVFSVVATDLSTGFQDVLLRDIDTKNNRIDGPYTVNQTFKNTVTQHPDIDIDFGGIRHVVWTDNRSTEKLFSIYLTLLDSFGNRLLQDDVEVNNLFDSTNTAEPALAVTDAGDITVVWRDDRNFVMDVFARRLRWINGRVEAVDDTDFQVNVPFNNTNVSHPDVVMDTQGNIVVAWSDDRVLLDGRKRNDIYARLFTFSTAFDDKRQLPGTVPEIQVTNSDSIYDQAREPHIAIQNGKILIVWRNADPTTSNSSIHASLLNTAGEKLQQEFVVSEDNGSIKAMAPSVSAMKNGLFLITWYDESNSRILGRIYDAENHLFLQEPVSLIDNVAATERTSVAAGDLNRSLVVWDGVTRGFRDIFGASLTTEFDNGIASVPKRYFDHSHKDLVPQSTTVKSVENKRTGRTVKSERTSDLKSPKRQ